MTEKVTKRSARGRAEADEEERQREREEKPRDDRQEDRAGNRERLQEEVRDEHAADDLDEVLVLVPRKDGAQRFGVVDVTRRQNDLKQTLSN